MSRENLVCWLLAGSGAIAAIGGLSTATQGEKYVALLLLAVGVFAAAGTSWRSVTTPKLLLILAYTGLVEVSLIRSLGGDVAFVSTASTERTVMLVALLVAFACTALFSNVPAETAARRVRFAMSAPAVLVLANFSLWIVGYRFPAGPTPVDSTPGPSETLALIGIHRSRASFPLTPGLNGAGCVAAVALVISVVSYTRGDRKRLNAVAAAVSTATIAWVDARGALVFSILTVAILLLLPRFAKQGIVALPALLPIAPVALLWLLSTFSSYLTGLGRNGGDVTQATGRSVVWHTIFNYLSHPHFEDLYGYGYYGQVVSQVGYRYAYLFYAYHPESASAHNLILQSILDIGYFGAALLILLFMVAIAATARRYAAAMSTQNVALLAALIVMVISSVTEAVPDIYFPYAFAVMIVLLCVALRTDWPDAGDGPQTATVP